MALSPSAATRRAMARLQRLCCLGLGGERLMAILNEIVPASTRHFYWPDLRMEIANCYVEGPGLDFLPIFLSEFTGGRREREVRMTFPEMMRTRYPSAAGDIFPRFFTVD